MTVRSAISWVAALCAVAVAAALGATAAVERARPGITRPPPEEFARLDLPRIDFHEHVGPNTVEDALRLARANGIDALVNLSGGAAGGELERQLAAVERARDRVFVFMNLELTGCCGPGWSAREAARLAVGKGLGARGLKVFKSLGLTLQDASARERGLPPLEARLPVDTPLLEPIWDACARLGLPVVVHAGDPKAFFEPPGPANERDEELALVPEWSRSDRGRSPPWQQVFDEFVRLVERHPRVTFVGAHFGNDAEDPAAVARLLDRLPNLLVDTAARVPELGRRSEATRLAILAHPDRVLFGTDLQYVEWGDEKAVVFGAGLPGGLDDMRRFFDGTYRFFETRDRAIPSPTPIQGDWTVAGMGLPLDVLEKVYHRNAERLLRVRLPERKR